MKRLVLLTILSVLCKFSFAQTAAKETIVIKTAIHCDHCQQCNSCGQNINDAIRDTKGVSQVKIDPKENTITVTYKPSKTSPEKIRLAIAAAGYDADEVKATEAGYAKLDDCCKKH